MQSSLKTKYKIWDGRYDFSEINKLNFRQVFKTYFKLTTKKVTLMAMLLGLSLIFGLISQFALAPLKVGGFLSFNITLWTTIIAFMAFNFFYSFLILEFTVWIRFLYGGGDIAGTLAINLNDLTFLILLCLIMQLANYIRFQVQKDYSSKNKSISYFWTLLISLILATILTTGMDLLYNYAFMINMYNILFGTSLISSDPAILILLLWFNIVQGIINVGIFLTLYHVTFILVNSYII